MFWFSLFVFVMERINAQEEVNEKKTKEESFLLLSSFSSSSSAGELGDSTTSNESKDFLFGLMDNDGNGKISLEELTHVILPSLSLSYSHFSLTLSPFLISFLIK